MVLHVMQTAHFSVIAEARELTKLKVKVTHYKYNVRILKLCVWLVEESAWHPKALCLVGGRICLVFISLECIGGVTTD